MPTTTRVINTDGKPVGPGEYAIIDTRLHVTSVARPNGFTIEQQDVLVVHTVVPFQPAVTAAVATDAPADTQTDAAADERRYCGRCDFYTDHVSTAHDGLAARGLLRSKGEGTQGEGTPGE